jgi:hypothetical protein
MLYSSDRLYPGTPLYSFYVGRLDGYLAEPPALAWDGATTFPRNEMTFGDLLDWRIHKEARPRCPH